MKGYHDDIIMAYAMAIFVAQTSFKQLERVEKQTKAMLESWIAVTNQPVKPTFSTPNTTPSYYQPQIQQQTNNNNGEYDWLFGIRR